MSTTIADTLFEAQTAGRAVPMFADLADVAAAYAVQGELLDRYRAAGQRLVGWKAGLTSKAKMQQMGVDEPTIGFLTDAMAVPEQTTVTVADLVHPRVECEVAFVLGRDLPADGCTVDDVVAATAFVVPAIEIIDSRYENFSFDLPNVIADNSSSSRFVLGGRGVKLDDLRDRTTLGVAILRNGHVETTGASAAVLGDPAAGVATVATIAGGLGHRLTAGQVVLSGGITAAIAVDPGDNVEARFQTLGTLGVRFE
ncbi:MAG: 2-keto-4-pentenoate hydratase [Acidimicrobiales bacterium]